MRKILLFGVVAGTVVWAIYAGIGRHEGTFGDWLWCVGALTVACVLVNALKGNNRVNG